MPSLSSQRLFCAVDTPDLETARTLVQTLSGVGCGIKLGLEFFMANGPAGVNAAMKGVDVPLFVDVKLHDIPNTVAGAVRALVQAVAPDYLTLHSSGGQDMMQAAAEAAQQAAETYKVKKPRLLAVTVLTSLDASGLRAVGQDDDTDAQVRRLAQLAQASGIDGLVCSAKEVAALRQILGHAPDLVTPGIRPLGADVADQKRVATPTSAIQDGASHLVVGRPITQAENPAVAAQDIITEIEAACVD